MIVHDLPLPVKQVKIDSYYFCLMLVLVISKIEISVLYVFILRVQIIPCVTEIIF